jgi:hypothetical protein
MPRQNWPARWCGRLGDALRYILYISYNLSILVFLALLSRLYIIIALGRGRY